MRIQSTTAKYVLVFYSGLITILFILPFYNNPEVPFDYYSIGNVTLKPDIVTEEQKLRFVPKAQDNEFTVNETDFEVPQTFSDEFPLLKNFLNPVPQYKSGRIETRNRKFVIGLVSPGPDDSASIATVHKLFSEVSNQNRQLMCVVVELSGLDSPSEIIKRIKRIQNQFSDEIKNGNIEIIVPAEGLYPVDWSSMRHMEDDLITDVKQRVISNADNTFLMMYSYFKHIKYFILIDQYATAVPKYIAHTVQAINKTPMLNWFYISLNNEHNIAKVFRSSDLPTLATFVKTYWNAKAVNTLLHDFVKVKLCSYDEDGYTCDARLATVLPNSEVPIFYIEN